MNSKMSAVARAIVFGMLLLTLLPRTTTAEPTFHPTQRVKVIKVNNGQEVLVELEGQGRAVRLACVQAPLTQQQPWAKQAKDSLYRSLPQGTVVVMELRGRDVYGRIVARLINDGSDVAEPLVADGSIFAYDGYVGRCDDLPYRSLERQAKDRKSGLWAVQGGVERPWDVIETYQIQGEP